MAVVSVLAPKKKVPTGIVPQGGKLVSNYGPTTYDVGGKLVSVPSLSRSPAPTAPPPLPTIDTSQIGTTPLTSLTAGDPFAQFKTAITGDYSFDEGQKASDLALAQARGSLIDQYRQAVINSGYVPDMTGELANYKDALDQATIDAATSNPLSQKAQLDKQYNTALSNLGWALAGRGTGSGLRGGANVVATTGLKDQYDVTSNSIMQSLLAALNQGAVGYNSFAAQQAQALSNLREQIAQRLTDAGWTPSEGAGGTTEAGANGTLFAPIPGAFDPSVWSTIPGNGGAPAAAPSPPAPPVIRNYPSAYDVGGKLVTPKKKK